MTPPTRSRWQRATRAVLAAARRYVWLVVAVGGAVALLALVPPR
ncbi:MAG: hypothetical protein M0013_12030 [Actinomycetota bacterium]|nr:hypothetical protein [Actinomycetota bacterium]